MRNDGIIKTGEREQRWMTRAAGLAVCATIAISGCGSDDTEGASSSEMLKGSCLISASDRTPVALGTQNGRNVRVTGTFDVAQDGPNANVCLEDLQVDAPGDIQIRLFNGLFGGYASDQMTLTASDLATYTSFSFQVKANEAGSYSIGFFEGSGESLNELATGFDETAAAQESSVDNAAFLQALCSNVTDADLTAAFPRLAGSELLFDEYKCTWPTAEMDPGGLGVAIHNPNNSADYIAGQRDSISDDANVDLGELAVYDSNLLRVFANGFLIEMSTYAEVPDLEASMTAIAAILVANL